MKSPSPCSLSPQFEAELVAVLPHLRAFARSLTRHNEEADDLASEAVLRAIRAARHFEPGTNFRAWIFTILRNLFYNQTRRARLRLIERMGAETEEPAVAGGQEDALRLVDFRQAFRRLGVAQREALAMIGADGLTYEEAAALCGCQLGTIKSRVSRARADLKQFMEGEERYDRAPPLRPSPPPGACARVAKSGDAIGGGIA